MDRFFHYWQQRLSISAEVRHYIRCHAEVIDYPSGDHFMQFGERRPYWCMVLEGLTYGYILLKDGRRRILWFAQPMQGFAGVQHLYTPQRADHAIRFVLPTTILRITALRMREAKERYPEVSELLHIHEQRYIRRQAKTIRILAQPDTRERYAAFLTAFPEIAAATTGQEQADFLNMGRTKLVEARTWMLQQK